MSDPRPCSPVARPPGAPITAARRGAGPRSRQHGLSMLSVLVILGTAMFFGTFAFKVGPAYFENMTINKIVADKQADESLRAAPRSKVYKALNTAYNMNNIRGLRAEDTVTLKKDKTRGYLMTVAYEKRANLFANIDVVTHFEKVVNP